MEARRRVAREAAWLLYTGAAEDYREAKLEAARSLGVETLPSNYEVALELDALAEEMEGEERRRRLLDMRREALEIMRLLSAFNPRLIGSVWRGTARRGSDIDIVVYAEDPVEVEELLMEGGYAIRDVEEVSVHKGGEIKTSCHIYIPLNDYEAEIVVRHPDEMGRFERCEIYGDLKRGLTLSELERIMRVDPLRRFVPERRLR